MFGTKNRRIVTAALLLLIGFVIFAACKNPAKSTIPPPAQPESYTVTVVQPLEGGMLDATPLNAQAGTTIIITAYPDDEYRFESFTIIKTGGDLLAVNPGTGLMRTFTMPTSNVTVTADFIPDTGIEYDITIIPSSGGGVTADKLKAIEGEQVTLSVLPLNGYSLSSLTVTKQGGSIVQLTVSGDNRTFTMPDNNVIVTSTFNVVQGNSITVQQPASGGVISASKNAAMEGEEITLTATQPEGFAFNGFTVTLSGGATVELEPGDGLQRSFIMPDASVTVTASYTSQQYSITVNQPASGGTISANGKTSAYVGESVSLTATPQDSGFLLDYFTVTLDPSGDPVALLPGGGNNREFIMPAGNVNVSAAFRTATGERYEITVASGISNGAISSDKSDAAEGEMVTITATPYPNYRLDSVTVTKNDSSGTIQTDGTGNARTFYMPSEPVSVTAAFVLQTYSISVQQGFNGMISVNVTTAAIGAAITVTAIPNQGFTLSQLLATDSTGNPVSLSDTVDPNQKVFFMPSSNVSVTGSFIVRNYNVYIDPVTHGQIEANPNVNLPSMTQIYIVAIPDAGYAYKENSLSINNGNVYPIPQAPNNGNPAWVCQVFSDDLNIYCEFELIRSALVIGSIVDGWLVPPLNGAILVEPSGTVAATTVVTLTAWPNAGYEYKEDTITAQINAQGGAAVPLTPIADDASGNKRWTFTMPTSPVIVNCSFSRLPPAANQIIWLYKDGKFGTEIGMGIDGEDYGLDLWPIENPVDLWNNSTASDADFVSTERAAPGNTTSAKIFITGAGGWGMIATLFTPGIDASKYNLVCETNSMGGGSMGIALQAGVGAANTDGTIGAPAGVQEAAFTQTANQNATTWTTRTLTLTGSSNLTYFGFVLNNCASGQALYFDNIRLVPK